MFSEMTRRYRILQWLFVALLVLEVAALAVALRIIPNFDANEAVLVVAVNGVLMVLVAQESCGKLNSLPFV